MQENSKKSVFSRRFKWRYLRRFLRFAHGVIKERIAIRKLLESDNIRFVRDYEPGHFYSPLPDINDLRSRASSLFDTTVRKIPGISLKEAEQLKLLDEFACYYKEIPFRQNGNGAHRYSFENPFFGYGDGVILYSMMRHFRPRRIIEVGSGYSSAEMLDVNELFLQRQIQFTFIDPFPERLHGLLAPGDELTVRIESKAVQDVDPEIFRTLEKNDVLFIDSSHVAKIGSDVLYLVLHILPILNEGVIIHFHDIFWPFEYPKDWLQEGRAWNEAYFLRALLQCNTNFEILFFNSYMAHHHSEEMHLKMPLFLRTSLSAEMQYSGSLWLRKVRSIVDDSCLQSNITNLEAVSPQSGEAQPPSQRNNEHEADH